MLLNSSNGNHFCVQEGREDKERSRPTWRSEEDRSTRVEKDRSAPRSQRSGGFSEIFIKFTNLTFKN